MAVLAVLDDVYGFDIYNRVKKWVTSGVMEYKKSEARTARRVASSVQLLIEEKKMDDGVGIKVRNSSSGRSLSGRV